MRNPGLFRLRRREATDGFPTLRLVPRAREGTVELFIDISAWLGVHLLSHADLTQLEALVPALAQGSVRLHAPEVLLGEYRRQRARLLHALLARIRRGERSRLMPVAFRHEAQYGELGEIEQAYVRTQSLYLDRIAALIDAEELASDKLVNRLFAHAYRAPPSRALRRRARERYALCNPPGDRGGQADALVWETLLATIPQGARLHLVSEAPTYSTEGEESVFNGFLLDEWRERTAGDISFYPRLWQFLDEVLPEAALPDAAQIDMHITAFVQAPNALQRARAAQTLSDVPDFSPAQLERLFQSVIQRSDTCSIGEGDAVHSLLIRLAYEQADSFEPYTLEVLRAVLAEATGPQDAEGR